jgi:hypothetical protein
MIEENSRSERTPNNGQRNSMDGNTSTERERSDRIQLAKHSTQLECVRCALVLYWVSFHTIFVASWKV